MISTKFDEENKLVSFEYQSKLKGADNNILSCTFEQFDQFDIASQFLVVICGENPTYLNVRKDITDAKYLQLQQNQSSIQSIDQLLQKELNLIALVNQKYRKSSKSWSYRYSIFSKLSDIIQKASLAIELIKKEVNFCNHCNIYEPRNYYIWTYRLQIIALAWNTLSSSMFKKLVQEEIFSINEHLKKQPKDSSAQHYVDQIKSDYNQD
ncbi:UNKNOWN [Stylonychia lemnae]|uniref:Uncharacterized protein n=1 Tax=Stylonychia lemnae TaxID=5949 RepID=A0A078ATR2_STYLE|nr:UNKNOWN [Stylonychia lemnae]|eukprot:CDW84233.1 UNKNOWN [Stylonychia lemnae]